MVLSICNFHMAAVAITYLALYVDRKTQIIYVDPVGMLLYCQSRCRHLTMGLLNNVVRRPRAAIDHS